MLKRKQQLLTYVDVIAEHYLRAAEAAPELLKEPSRKFTERQSELVKKLTNSELLVPIVGGFSAGKSTAINGLLGQELLPVAITPETAIPAELRFAEEEYLLTVTPEGQEERYAVEALAELSERAHEFEYVKLFLNKPVLKEIEPLVLVDMPGFDSPLEGHNNAILRYLARGVHYLFLACAKDGTLQKQELFRMSEVYDNRKAFSVCLTKSDLCVPSELKQVVGHIKDLLEARFMQSFDVKTINHEAVQPLLDQIKTADPEKLFDNEHKGAVKELFYQVSGSLNTAASSLEQDQEGMQKKIEELKRKIDAISHERDQQVQTLSVGLVADKEQQVMVGLEQSLTGAIGDLAMSARSGGDALNRAVSDQVRSALIHEMQRATRGMSTDAVSTLESSYQFDLKSDLKLGKDWMQNVANLLQGEVMKALMGAAERHKKGSAGTALTTTLSSLAIVVPHPAVKVVLAVLPSIVSALFSKFSEQRELEQIKEAVRSQVIPEVLNQVRPEVSNALNSAAKTMLESVIAQFEEKLKEQHQMLEQLQLQSAEQEQMRGKSLVAIKSAQEKIDEITSELLV